MVFSEKDQKNERAECKLNTGYVEDWWKLMLNMFFRSYIIQTSYLRQWRKDFNSESDMARFTFRKITYAYGIYSMVLKKITTVTDYRT